MGSFREEFLKHKIVTPEQVKELEDEERRRQNILKSQGKNKHKHSESNEQEAEPTS